MIDISKTRLYTLSIRLSADGFCFAVHNPQVDGEYTFMPYQIDAQKSMLANIKAAVENIEILKQRYAAVNVLFADAPYTVIPKEYYDEECARDLYMQNFPATPSTTLVLYNTAGEGQAVLFGVERRLHQFLAEHFPKACFYSSVTPLINYGVEKSFACERNFCLAHLNKHRVDLLCFNHGAPMFINTFDNRETSDTLYFLLNCWQCMALSQTDDTLHLAGVARNGKTLAEELGRFIKNVRFLRPAEEFHSSELARVNNMPFDLQTLIACE